jgi:Porin subfamily
MARLRIAILPKIVTEEVGCTGLIDRLRRDIFRVVFALGIPLAAAAHTGAFAQMRTGPNSHTKSSLPRITEPPLRTEGANRCAVYGAGFYPIPGTGTCLKLGGSVTVEGGAAATADPAAREISRCRQSRRHSDATLESWIDGEIAPLYSDKARPGLETRFVIGPARGCAHARHFTVFASHRAP